MLILGIESSCDETGVAIVDGKGRLLADALHSQVDLHAAYGGVVPELASRDHVERLLPLVRLALDQAKCRIDQIDVIAYTAGPGLAGALLTGASVAEGLAYALGKPARPIHHLEGHLLSPMLASPAPLFPFLALLVSGGHTLLARVDEVGKYVLLGDTLDDAAGEAFDKTAKMLGLPYPGGPALAALAEKGNPQAYSLPRPLWNSGTPDFSFSGLKTAVATLLRKLEPISLPQQADLAASIEAAIVEVLVKKSLQAMQQSGLTRLVVAGGVSANLRLRAALKAAIGTLSKTRPGKSIETAAEVFFPPPRLCTDNGAMIAFAAALRFQRGLLEVNASSAEHSFQVHPRWSLFTDPGRS